MKKTPFTVLPETVSGLNNTIESAMSAHNVRGLAAAVLHEDRLVYQACFGSAGNGRAMDETIHFEAASLTKPVFGYVVLTLAAQGRFDLDRPLATYPVKPPTDDARIRLLTPRHVLTHSSGLPNWGEKPLPMRFSPGNGFHYSGEGYAYLQRVIEQATGRRLDHLLQDEVFNPFGMDSAAMVWTAPLNKTLAVAHDASGEPEPLRSSVWHRIGYYEPNAAFSLYATIRDYPKFLLNAVTPDFVKSVLETQNPAGKNVNWGLSWGVYHGALWHWGDNGGYKSFVCRNAEAGDAVLVHTNSFSGLAACKDIVNAVTDTDFSDVFAFIETAE